jgi:hypothetical protein
MVDVGSMSYKRSKRFGVGKETWEGKRRFRRHKVYRERRLRRITDVDAMNAISPKYSEEDRD